MDNNLFSCNSGSWWTWNLGFMTGMALSLQVVSGVGLAMGYDPGHAFIQLEEAESHGGYWAWRKAHSTGASMYFLAMYAHMASSIFCSSLSGPSSCSGAALYFLSVGVALLGYSLAEGNMARWALTVVASVVLSLPAGETMFPVMVGDYGITNKMLPRIYTLHFLLGLMCPVFVLWHTVEVHHSDFSTDLTTASGKSGKEFISGSMVKDSLMTGMFSLTLLQGFNEVSYMWGLMEDVNANDWPQDGKTPEPMGPEWYVLPLFAGLKLTSIYGLMVMLLTTILAYLQPRSGFTAQFSSGLSVASLLVLGLLALSAHESLMEPYLMAFILILTNMTAYLGQAFETLWGMLKQEISFYLGSLQLSWLG